MYVYVYLYVCFSFEIKFLNNPHYYILQIWSQVMLLLWIALLLLAIKVKKKKKELLCMAWDGLQSILSGAYGRFMMNLY